MDAAPMVAKCEQLQALGEDLPHAALVVANVARWFAGPRDTIHAGDEAVYTTYCDRCRCDHAAPQDWTSLTP